MDKPLLTICIPAYNRPDTLSEVLESIKKQNSAEIRVIVSDDASPDANAMRLAVDPYLQSMENLSYHRKESNVGYSANVISLYEMADTRYIWFFCDDDIPLEGSIQTVLGQIKSKEPVVAVFNHMQFDPYERYIEAGVKHDVVYTDISQIRDYQELQRITFLSVLVVEKRDISLEQLKQTDYTNNVFVQLTLSLMLLSDKFRYCQLAKPILHRNVGYNYGDFFKFYIVDHLRAVNIVKTKFDPNKFLFWSFRHLPIAFNLYLSQKLGLYAYRKRPTLKTIKDIFRYWGALGILPIVIPVVSFFIPSILLKGIFMLMLIKDHGYERAKYLYAKNINRAYNDTRKTGFINYR